MRDFLFSALAFEQYNEWQIENKQVFAGFLNTTVGYLLGETEKSDLFKDPAMLARLSDLDKMGLEDKSHILHGFIKSVKFKHIAAL